MRNKTDENLKNLQENTTKCRKTLLTQKSFLGRVRAKNGQILKILAFLDSPGHADHFVL